MKQWFKSLTPTMQFVIVIIAIIIIWQIYKVGRNYVKRGAQFTQDLGEQAALAAQGVKKSYTDGQYRGFADQLYYAMKGWGTDEELIMSVFGKMKNDLDIIELNNKFGIRDGYDLQGWLRDDLSSSDMNRLNGLLSNKGITKTF